MLITVKTFDGHNINDGTNYRAVLLNPHGLPDAAPVFLEQTNADPLDAGTYTVNVQQKVLSIRVLNYANRNALISQLKTWFKRGTRGELVVNFADDGVDYQLNCRAINMVQDTDGVGYFKAILQTGTSAWRAVSETMEATWTVTGTSETQDIAVAGRDETYLSVELTSVDGPAGGFLYQNIYRLPNTPGLAHGLIPWCITVNTAALVSAGKMQADCDDLRIVNMSTGQEIKRWIANPNNAATKVWINLDLAKGYSLTLLTSVAGSGSVTELAFDVNEDTKAKIAEMPKTGIVYHGTEWFAYSGTDAVNCKLTISQRGLFDTALAAHTAGDAFVYIQYPLLMKYGNTSVASPASTDATYDDTKPLINLSSSSNTSWVWDTTTKFYDPDHPNRQPAWKFRQWNQGPFSKIFHVKRDALSGDPAIGLKVASYLVGSTWMPENPILSAQFYRSARITSVSVTGESYRTNANWPFLTAFRFGFAAGDNNTNLWTESAPASEATWTAWTHNGVTLSVPAPYVLFVLAFSYAAAANAYAIFEMLTCTMDFSSSNIPTGALLGEISNYPLVLTIENTTTGDAIALDYMMLIGSTFAIDGETKIVQYGGYNAYGAVTPNDAGRSAYLRLAGGVTNTIRISGTDLGELAVVLSYYRRRL